MPPAASSIDRLAERLASARRVTVLTGAGVSAASGVPTFRGDGGLWRTHNAMELATPGAFARNPTLVWEWYDWRRQAIAAAVPNRAHEVLAAWSHRWPGLTLITQNVDGLHERSGARDVIRLHGSIWQVRCTGRCRDAAPRQDDRVPLPAIPPRCETCDSLLRPGVVWFGEALDPSIVIAASAAVACDVFLTIGTSALVYPAAGLTHEARAHGAFVVEINLDVTDASAIVDLALHGPAETILPDVEAALTRR